MIATLLRKPLFQVILSITLFIIIGVTITILIMPEPYEDPYIKFKDSEYIQDFCQVYPDIECKFQITTEGINLTLTNVHPQKNDMINVTVSVDGCENLDSRADGDDDWMYGENLTILITGCENLIPGEVVTTRFHIKFTKAISQEGFKDKIHGYLGDIKGKVKEAGL